MVLTGLLLILDLDVRTGLHVLLRPQWKLVRGAYIITVFGGLVTLKKYSIYMEFKTTFMGDMLASIFANLGVTYTAFIRSSQGS